MKRFDILLIILILVIGVNIGKSQNLLNVGVKAGTSISKFTGDNVDKSGLLTTFNGGFFLNYSPVTYFSLQPEANLSFKGGNYNVRINDFPYHRASVVYAQIPLLFQFSSKKELKSTVTKPSIFFGPAINFRLNAELEGMPLPNLDGGYSLNQETEYVAFEMIGGIGATIKDLYIVDLRYEYGLSNIFKSGDVKASSIALTLGFLF